MRRIVQRRLEPGYLVHTGRGTLLLTYGQQDGAAYAWIIEDDDEPTVVLRLYVAETDDDAPLPKECGRHNHVYEFEQHGAVPGRYHVFDMNMAKNVRRLFRR